MRPILILCLLALTACDSAGPGFRSAPALHRSVEGSRFTLRFAGDIVEAVRTSPEWLPRFETVARKAILAVADERPNCRTEWVEGDPALLMLGLSCDGHAAPKRPKRTQVYFCDLPNSTRVGKP